MRRHEDSCSDTDAHAPERNSICAARGAIHETTSEDFSPPAPQYAEMAETIEFQILGDRHGADNSIHSVSREIDSLYLQPKPGTCGSVPGNHEIKSPRCPASGRRSHERGLDGKL